MRTERPRTAVLFDSYPLWLEAIHNIVVRQGITVVGQSTSELGAFTALAEHSPDLFVAGLEQPASDPHSAALLRRALAATPAPKVIMLSESALPVDIECALELGVFGYLTKRAHAEDLGIVITQAFDQSLFLAGPTSSGGVGRLPENGTALTRREAQVLTLVAQGRQNAEVARALWVTEQTVKFHLSNVFRKLGVSNRTEASSWARDHGLLDKSASAPVPLGVAYHA